MCLCTQHMYMVLPVSLFGNVEHPSSPAAHGGLAWLGSLASVPGEYACSQAGTCFCWQMHLEYSASMPHAHASCLCVLTFCCSCLPTITLGVAPATLSLEQQPHHTPCHACACVACTCMLWLL